VTKKAVFECWWKIWSARLPAISCARARIHDGGMAICHAVYPYSDVEWRGGIGVSLSGMLLLLLLQPIEEP